MIYCVHCGTQLDDNAEICFACGRYSDADYVLTISMGFQYFLLNRPTKICLSAPGFVKHLEVENGGSVNIKLLKNKYKMSASYLGRSGLQEFTLSKNMRMFIDVSIDNKSLTIKEI